MWTWTKRIAICVPAVALIVASGLLCIAGFYDAMGWLPRHHLQPGPGLIEWLWCAFWLVAMFVGMRGFQLVVRKARAV